VCAECSEFPCAKFKSEEEYKQLKENTSYSSGKNILPNLFFIKEKGIDKFIQQQKKRIQLLKTMINKFDDGRSRSFFCRTATFIDSTVLSNSIEEANKIIKNKKISLSDMKSKASILRKIISDIPIEE
jgi:hypothetical protein